MEQWQVNQVAELEVRHFVQRLGLQDHVLTILGMNYLNLTVITKSAWNHGVTDSGAISICRLAWFSSRFDGNIIAVDSALSCTFLFWSNKKFLLQNNRSTPRYWEICNTLS